MQVSSIYPSNTQLPGTEFLFSKLRNVSFVLLLPLLTQTVFYTPPLSAQAESTPVGPPVKIWSVKPLFSGKDFGFPTSLKYIA